MMAVSQHMGTDQ